MPQTDEGYAAHSASLNFQSISVLSFFSRNLLGVANFFQKNEGKKNITQVVKKKRTQNAIIKTWAQ